MVVLQGDRKLLTAVRIEDSELKNHLRPECDDTAIFRNVGNPYPNDKVLIFQKT